jgi:O-antigen/teichoic acid export membrane protein
MNSTATLNPAELTRGHLLARSSLWNIAGQVLPMVAALVAIPPILRGIGIDRFGILTLGWVVVGYFSLFDFGLGRALTKIVASELSQIKLTETELTETKLTETKLTETKLAGTKMPDAAAREATRVVSIGSERRELYALIWTSSLLLVILGVMAGGAMFFCAPWLVDRILKIPAALKTETLHALYLLAASLPVITSSSGFRGILEALQRFDTVNRIRIPMALSIFLGPLVVLPFSKSLVVIFAFLVAGRTLAWIAFVAASLRALPGLGHGFALGTSGLKPAFQFGGWITAGNLLVPVLAYVDRFIIGALLSVGIVAFYATPFEAVTRLQAIPGAVAGVMFPAFASTFVQDPRRTALLMERAVKYIFLAVFPVVLLIVAFAPEGLKLWVGPLFAQNSTIVLRALAAGVFVNCLAQIPLSLVQGTGRPDLAAKLQALELPFYLPAVFWATKHFGLEGAALAWTLRVTVDALLLFAISYHLLPPARELAARLAAAVAVALAIFYGITLASSPAIRALLAATVMLVAAGAAWFRLLVEDERALLRGFVFPRSKVAA